MKTKNSYMHSLRASELYGGMQSVSHSRSFTPETKIHCGLTAPVWTQQQSEKVPVRGKVKRRTHLLCALENFKASRTIWISNGSWNCKISTVCLNSVLKFQSCKTTWMRHGPKCVWCSVIFYVQLVKLYTTTFQMFGICPCKVINVDNRHWEKKDTLQV